MKIKKFLIVFLISIFTFATITQAQPIPPISNTYKQGIYDLSLFNGYSASVNLITPNTAVTLMVVDSDGKLVQFIRLNTIDETVKLGIGHNGDVGIILGTGEVAIFPSK